MFVSAAIGLIVMAGAFIFFEWLNHAVVHADRFLARPEFSQALIKGVPNVELLYVCATADHVRAFAAIKAGPNDDEIVVTLKIDNGYYINANPRRSTI